MVVIFVDGHSLRYVLGTVLPDFDPERSLLPVSAGWRPFFAGLAQSAKRSPFTTVLLRSYWYVPGSFVGCNEIRRPEKEVRERRVLAMEEQEALRKNHQAIARIAGDLEFVSAGSRKYKFDKDPKNAWAGEKGVDVAMAVDMLRKTPIYDLAIVLTRDADFIPAINAVKDVGRIVVVPRFTDPQGKLIIETPEELLVAADRTFNIEDLRMRELLVPKE
jgi:hypothetical protein